MIRRGKPVQTCREVVQIAARDIRVFQEAERMTDIVKKLEAARDKAKGYGKLYGAWDTAKEKLELVYALLDDDSVGETVKEKDSWVKRQPKWEVAVEAKENAAADWKEAEVWMKLLMLEAEVWRTEQANNRYMDQAHR